MSAVHDVLVACRDAIQATIGIYGATFIIAIISGFVPLVNAEIYLAAVAISTKSIPLAIVLGMITALGQMVAKVGIYKAAQKGANLKKYEENGKLEKARRLMAKWKDKPHVLTFISASTGIPPFFIVSLVGGLLELPFAAFMAVGFVGRSIRFVTVAIIAVML
ncbi:MAG TPA: hypothetical protein VGM90_20090 [Kofleriaceae bacterium]